jgi:hypothetical protein
VLHAEVLRANSGRLSTRGNGFWTTPRLWLQRTKPARAADSLVSTETVNSLDSLPASEESRSLTSEDLISEKAGHRRVRCQWITPLLLLFMLVYVSEKLEGLDLIPISSYQQEPLGCGSASHPGWVIWDFTTDNFHVPW